MERFRLRVHYQPKRGQIWELHLFPEQPAVPVGESGGRSLGSVSSPGSQEWLRALVEPFTARADTPCALVEELTAGCGSIWLRSEDGMRLALAFSAAKWLAGPHQRSMFASGLQELPSEVILYWFTLCFYGYRQAAGRAALRTLLTHEEPEPTRSPAARGPRQDSVKGKATLFPGLPSDR